MKTKNDRPGRTDKEKPARGERRLSDKSEIRKPTMSDDTLKKAIANAVEEKNRSNAIIQAIGDGMMIQDTDFKILIRIRFIPSYMGTKSENTVTEYTVAARSAKAALLYYPSGMERYIKLKKKLSKTGGFFIMSLRPHH